MEKHLKMMLELKRNTTSAIIFILSNIIDYGLFLFSFIYMFYLPISSYTDLPEGTLMIIGFFIWIVIEILSCVIFKGSTIGKVVFNIRRMSVIDDEPFIMSSRDVFHFIIETYWHSFKLNNTYESFKFWSNYPHQSPVMYENDVYFISKRKFNKITKLYKK